MFKSLSWIFFFSLQWFRTGCWNCLLGYNMWVVFGFLYCCCRVNTTILQKPYINFRKCLLYWSGRANITFLEKSFVL